MRKEFDANSQTSKHLSFNNFEISFFTESSLRYREGAKVTILTGISFHTTSYYFPYYLVLVTILPGINFNISWIKHYFNLYNTALKCLII